MAGSVTRLPVLRSAVVSTCLSWKPSLSGPPVVGSSVPCFQCFTLMVTLLDDRIVSMTSCTTSLTAYDAGVTGALAISEKLLLWKRSTMTLLSICRWLTK